MERAAAEREGGDGVSKIVSHVQVYPECFRVVWRVVVEKFPFKIMKCSFVKVSMSQTISGREKVTESFLFPLCLILDQLNAKDKE